MDLKSYRHISQHFMMKIFNTEGLKELYSETHMSITWTLQSTFYICFITYFTIHLPIPPSMHQ